MFVTIRKHKLSGQKIAGHGLVYGDLTKKNIPLFKRSFGWDHFCIAVEIRESESETWWPDNFEISQLILCPTTGWCEDLSSVAFCLAPGPQLC